jgi:hypothetical protein
MRRYLTQDRQSRQDQVAADLEATVAGRSARRRRYGSLRAMLGSVLRVLWWVVTLPVRLLFKAVEMLGRATALALGFVLMVVGVALSVGSAPVFGIPTFVVGLVVTLRSVE